MKKLTVVLVAACFPFALFAAFAPAPDVGARKVEHTVHPGYFESSASGLKGEASYLAVTERGEFDRLFGVGFDRGRPTQVLPRDAFDKKMVVAVIKRGNALWDYQVEKVMADKDTLYVHYKAAARPGATTPRGPVTTARAFPTTARRSGPLPQGDGRPIASPLVVAVEKAKYASVVFIENGKKVGTARVGN
jgi:hypothetical protein